MGICSPCVFTRVSLGLSCSHSSITTAAPVSTSQHCSLQPGHPVEAALRKCPARALLALASADTSCPKQQVEPLSQRKWQEKGAWSQSQGREATAPRGFLLSECTSLWPGPPMPEHWCYAPFLAYSYLGDPQTHPADPKSKGC